VDFHSVCLGPNTLLWKAVFSLFQGHFIRLCCILVILAHQKLKICKCILSFIFVINFVIFNDNLTYESHYVTKINELQKSRTECHIAQHIITANKVIQAILSEWFNVCCVHYKGTYGAWLYACKLYNIFIV